MHLRENLEFLDFVLQGGLLALLRKLKPICRICIFFAGECLEILLSRLRLLGATLAVAVVARDVYAAAFFIFFLFFLA